MHHVFVRDCARIVLPMVPRAMVFFGSELKGLWRYADGAVIGVSNLPR